MTATLSTPQYTIRVRDANLIPQGALSAWTAGDAVLRMNDVGKWALTVRADDALLSTFATRGSGIIVTRDLGDGSGAQTLLSGPIWTLDRLGRENYYTLGGPTDEWWLKARRVLPQGGRPYMEAVLRDAPIRYYRLGEASGTVATDSSGQGQAGTYVNAPTLGAVGAIPGDPNTAVTFNGTNQRMTIPTSGLPTGNAAWSIKAWAFLTALPTAGTFGYVLFLGTVAPAQMAAIGFFNSAGSLQPVCVTNGGDADGAVGGATINTWVHLVGTYDGTTVRLYVNGSLVASTAPTARNLTYGGASIGGDNGGAQLITGRIDEAAVYNVALTAARVTADYTAGTATHGAYDTRTGLASTVLLGYVAANITAPINIDRAMSTMTAAADPLIGTTVSGNARADELLALLQQLASAGGDIGFKVIQTANGVLTFSIYQPSDKSASIKFSQDLLNLFDYSYSLAGPQANSVMVWGGGLGAARTAVPVRDTTSIAAWGLVEAMVDARDTSDTATMQQRGQADINALTEQTNLALTPHDTATMRYGRDYNLGDIVAVTVDSNTITNKIRSVHIQLKPGDEELVTPAIGNPTQGEVARWFDGYAARQQALARVQAKLNALSAAQ